MKKRFSYNLKRKCERSVHSDLDLHCPPKASCVVISTESVNVLMLFTTKKMLVKVSLLT